MEFFLDFFSTMLGGVVNALADPDNTIFDKILISIVIAAIFAVLIVIAAVSQNPVISVAVVVILGAITVREIYLFASKKHKK